MFRRGFASLSLAGAILILAAPAVMADTVEVLNADSYVAYAQTEDGSAQASAQIGTFDDVPVKFLSAFTFIVQDVICADGTEGIILTALNASSESGVIKIDPKLKTAKASGWITGTEETYHSCTDETVIVDVRRHVSIDLQASGGSTTTKIRSVTRNPDGSKRTFNEKIDERRAGGTFKLGPTTFAANASVSGITHDVFTTVITPPRPH